MKKQSIATVVTVRKPLYSIYIPIFFLMVIALMTIYTTIKSGSGIIAFSLLPMGLCMVFSLAYNLYWHVDFKKDRIVYTSLFSHKHYTYSQMLEITEYYHYKGFFEIVILFKDNKKVTITQRYRNYIQCRKIISACRSIKTTWHKP